MAPSLSQSLGQYMRLEQRLTPQLIQSMNILQLNTLALDQRIGEELEKNFALEVTEPERRTEHTPREEVAGNGEVESFQRLERLAQEYGRETFNDAYRPSRAQPANGERDAKMDAMANAASRPESLTDHLLNQWATLEVAGPVRAAGELIIYNLEDDGYLRTRLDELADSTHPPTDLAALEEALPLVQRLDPVGIAARDYQECLLLQLEALPGDNRIEAELIRHHLPDVIRNRYPAVAKATGYSLGEITEAVRAMQSSLTLHPGYTVVDQPVQHVTPDVIAEYAETGDGLAVRLARGNEPRLRVSHAAMKMLKDRGSDRAVRDFVRQHVESASALIDAIRFRRDRLLAVAERIAEYQKEFFEQGPEGLKVLRMSDLAVELECDPSTVSRTVAGKYIQTPRGIFAMRYFFTGGTETASGESTSWDSVKLSVKQLIGEEDKQAPYNDDQVARILSERGVEISRRTVAKYRQQLDIPSARQRRQFT